MIRIPRHCDQIRSPILCTQLGPIQFDRHFTAVVRLSTVNHLTQVLDLDEASCGDPWSRPYFVAPLNCICS